MATSGVIDSAKDHCYLIDQETSSVEYFRLELKVIGCKLGGNREGLAVLGPLFRAQKG
jgi:hypothetical protein